MSRTSAGTRRLEDRDPALWSTKLEQYIQTFCPAFNLQLPQFAQIQDLCFISIVKGANPRLTVDCWSKVAKIPDRFTLPVSGNAIVAVPSARMSKSLNADLRWNIDAVLVLALCKFNDEMAKDMGWTPENLPEQFSDEWQGLFTCSSKEIRISTAPNGGSCARLTESTYCSCGWNQWLEPRFFSHPLKVGDMKWGPANQNKAFHDRSCLDASNGLHKDIDTVQSHHHRESDMGVYCGSAMNRISAAAQSAAIRHGTDNPLWVASFNLIAMLDNNALPAGTRPAVWQEAATSHVYSFEDQQTRDLRLEVLRLELELMRN